jgi:hypothetical protein
VQARRRRNNNILRVDGQSRTIAEWAAMTDQKYSTISKRVQREWPDEQAVFGNTAAKQQRIKSRLPGRTDQPSK